MTLSANFSHACQSLFHQKTFTIAQVQYPPTEKVSHRRTSFLFFIPTSSSSSSWSLDLPPQPHLYVLNYIYIQDFPICRAFSLLFSSSTLHTISFWKRNHPCVRIVISQTYYYYTLSYLPTVHHHHRFFTHFHYHLYSSRLGQHSTTNTHTLIYLPAHKE